MATTHLATGGRLPSRGDRSHWHSRYLLSAGAVLSTVFDLKVDTARIQSEAGHLDANRVLFRDLLDRKSALNCGQQKGTREEEASGQPVSFFLLFRVAVEKSEVSNSIDLGWLMSKNQVREFMRQVAIAPGDRLVKRVSYGHHLSVRQMDSRCTETLWLKFVKFLQLRQRDKLVRATHVNAEMLGKLADIHARISR